MSKSNEHTVPRRYLKHFSVKNDDEKIWVYKKENRKALSCPQNIENFATIHNFYDFDLKKYIENQYYAEQISDSDYEQLMRYCSCYDPKLIEKFFAEHVEGKLLKNVEKLSSFYSLITTKNLDYVSYISPDMRYEVSEYLAYQFLRTAKIRDGIEKIDLQLESIKEHIRTHIEDYYDVPKCEITPPNSFKISLEAIPVSKELVKLEHLLELTSLDNITDFAKMFCEDYIWRIGINKTKYPLYTSDNPVSKNRSGLKTDGVIISFPLSSRTILFLMDRKKYSYLSSKDGTYSLITESDVVDANRNQYYGAKQFIFCMENNFDMITDFEIQQDLFYTLPEAEKIRLINEYDGRHF